MAISDFCDHVHEHGRDACSPAPAARLGWQ
jgi:hypothetical protein